MSDISRETLDVDVLFVGAGPSNLSAAIHLKTLIDAHNKTAATPIPEPMIAVIEKGFEVGAHQVSGAVLNPSALKELIPDYLVDCPIESAVTDEAVYFLTQTSAFKFPLIPPQMNNHGNHVISLSKFTRWLGDKATQMGINLFTGFTGVDVLMEGSRVTGIVTGDKGLNHKGEPKQNFERGMNIRAKCTVFGEGVRGFLTKTLIPKLKLEGRHPPTFETGVKEVWQCAPGTIQAGSVIHTMGYPLDASTVGGSFIYGMKDDLLVVGLVVSLNYENPNLEPYQELQKLKNHPLLAKMLKGGKSVAYGAKAIASGGYYAIPKLTFDGGMIVGESASLLDMSRLKGIHVGMRSGMLAAAQIFENFKNQTHFEDEHLKAYSENFFKSNEGKDLYKARNFHQALSKGMPMAFVHLGAQQLTGGRGFIDPMPVKLDRNHYQKISEATPISRAAKTELVVDKLTSVYNAGTLHEEDQVPHLKIGNTKVCIDTCVETYNAPCNRFCPAQVYDMQKQETGLHLQINFTNCVHCQTCDIKCPMDNITWTPPESGGGPQYKIL